MQDDEVERAWRRIEAWLRRKLPDAALRGPATREDIARLEKLVGTDLPEDVVASFLLHDGQDDGPGLVLGYELSPLTEVARQWSTWREIAEDAEANEDLSERCASDPPGWVRERYASLAWIP